MPILALESSYGNQRGQRLAAAKNARLHRIIISKAVLFKKQKAKQNIQLISVASIMHCPPAGRTRRQDHTAIPSNMAFADTVPRQSCSSKPAGRFLYKLKQLPDSPACLQAKAKTMMSSKGHV